jgi:hypothetical protein
MFFYGSSGFPFLPTLYNTCTLPTYPRDIFFVFAPLRFAFFLACALCLVRYPVVPQWDYQAACDCLRRCAHFTFADYRSRLNYAPLKSELFNLFDKLSVFFDVSISFFGLFSVLYPIYN